MDRSSAATVGWPTVRLRRGLVLLYYLSFTFSNHLFPAHRFSLDTFSVPGSEGLLFPSSGLRSQALVVIMYLSSRGVAQGRNTAAHFS